MQSASLPSCLVNQPMIPVVTLTDAKQALPLADALSAGGITVIEITLRTAAGMAGIEQLKRHRPKFTVGVGTVSSVDDMARAAAIGVDFAVSPGIINPLVSEAQARGLFYLPGVVTPSEIMLAMHHGLRHVKFFPAEHNGGVTWLKQIASVFPDVNFCATGGINLDNMASYLQQANVFAIGGSWLVSQADLMQADWQAITDKARQAMGATQLASNN